MPWHGLLKIPWRFRPSSAGAWNFIKELFVFVSDPARPPRRHLVTSKISGGTRLTLASLFGTWRARGLNPLLECLAHFPSTLKFRPKRSQTAMSRASPSWVGRRSILYDNTRLAPAHQAVRRAQGPLPVRFSQPSKGNDKTSFANQTPFTPGFPVGIMANLSAAGASAPRLILGER